MPYIARDRRNDIAHGVTTPRDVGELTYLFTERSVDFLSERGDLSFAGIAQVVAALECTKLELYRRVASEYEDLKIELHGDVFPEYLRNPRGPHGR